MDKRKTGWPFQEGFLNEGFEEIHAFTDYRWNDGSISRRWYVDPECLDADLADLRPFSLTVTESPDQ